MAEGKQSTSSHLNSYSEGSADADEKFCDPCKTGDQWKAVEAYCPKCHEYLCAQCLRVHRKLNITRDHVTKDKTQMHRSPTIDSTATYNRSIDAKCGTDKMDCHIPDCALLSPDRLVAIDMNNWNVKLIDISKNTVKTTYNTSSIPLGVTVLSTNTIAITLPGEGKIQVLDVASTFTLQRAMKFHKFYLGIAYKDRKFAVSYTHPSRVDILTIQGKILYTIGPQLGEDCILQEPYFITFGPDNDTVVVSDWETHTVSVVTFSGQISRTYTHDTLRHPGGIVMAADGILYVRSLDDGCIHVVSPDFKTSKIIIKHDTHLEGHTGISYCDVNHTLFIVYGEGICSKIHAYDVNV